MSIEQQKAIWDKNWQHQSQITLKRFQISRFAQEAYHCLKNFINEKKDRLILEAGCGTGRFCCLLARDFPDAQVIGMDISPDDYFDIVFNEGVIEHYNMDSRPNYVDAVCEMIRVTKEEGKIIVAVPDWFNFPHTLYKWALKKLNKKFIYGYEKSFKHSELVKLFSELGLKEIEISGFYPSHGFYRLSGGSFHKIFYHLGRFTDIFNKFFDSLTDGYFTKKFGFEIVIKGVKP